MITGMDAPPQSPLPVLTSILTFDWKPSTNLAQASGSNSSVNAVIDNMADSVKSLGTTKVVPVLHHEPPNDVSFGTTCNMSGKRTSGSPADYRAM